jgi:UDP-N-acetylmuramoyl-L-alanyl-D-glutamate--2,6-diaminopimelate ligase
VDGHDYIDKALERGAVALVVQKPVAVSVPYLLVPDTRFAMAVLADHFYGHPSQALKVIGITGTNGKTTTAHLIDTLLRDAGHRADLMGTIAMRIGEETIPAKNTTQEALELHRNLRRMADGGADYAVMEVSSHALVLGRDKGVRYKTAVFTNLTQDHLDFHKTMDEYKAAKGLLFARLGNTYAGVDSQVAILNADDPASADYAALTSAEVITYGIDAQADVRATDVRVHTGGTSMNVQTYVGEQAFELKLVGKFNVYNTLAAIAVGLVEGLSLAQMAASLANIPGVNGRFEPVVAGQPFLCIVDYAHTPDSLENVLQTIEGFADGRIITVFGCGGDRDRTKRPLMGAIASRMSDITIVTLDNPRTEDPQAILDEIVTGIVAEAEYEVIENRADAIKKAIEIARPQDVVLIAGKGHETYQEIHGVRTDFDDREVAKSAIRGKFA